MVRKASKLAQACRTARERWQQGFQQNITQYHAYHDFVLGKQWTDDESEMLKSFRKPPLQVNKLRVLANNVLGELQQNTPQLQVCPAENCDYETAQIRETLVKEISLNSRAKAVTQIAASQALIGGFGAICVDTDYTHPGAWEQDLYIRSTRDATRFWWDLAAEETSKIDGMQGGYWYRMSRAKFRSLYGKNIEERISSSSIMASKEEIAIAVSPTNEGVGQFSYADDDSIVIMMWYRRKHKTDTLYRLSNGRSVYQDEMDKLVSASVQRNVDMMIESAQMDVDMDMPLDMNADTVTLYDGGEPVRIEDKRTEKR